MIRSDRVPSEARFPPAPFDVLGRIGRGGMGEVWLARRRHEDRLVALKRLLPEVASDPEAVALFLDEARLALRLSHPRIVRAFELVPGPDPVLVMAFVHGVSLHVLARAMAARREDFPLALAARLGAQAAAALAHAHALVDDAGRCLGVVHRDVCPHNLLVSFDGAIALVDFGIAKARGASHHTRTGVLRGKLQYMSPEQSRGEPLDGRSDVFALGCVLYELVTGAPPFAARTEPEVLRALDACRPRPPSERRGDLPEALERAILRALCARPEDRFAGCGALAEALEAAAPACPDEPADLGALARDLFPERADLPRWIDSLAGTRAELPPPAPPAPRPRAERPWLAGALGVIAPFAIVAAVRGPDEPPARSEPPPPAEVASATPVALGAPQPEAPAPPSPRARARAHPARATPTPAPHAPSTRGTPAPAAPAPAAESAGPGFVTFDIQPWADVELDGKSIGQTPLAGVAVPAGAHRVRFQNPRAGIQVALGFHVAAGERKVIRPARP